MGTPSWAGPLTTSPRGLWVSGLPAPCNGGSSRRAATLGPTKQRRGLTHNSRAGIPKRLRPNCQSRPRGTLEPAWVLHQGEGTQRPQRAKGKGPKDPGVAAPLTSAVCRGNCWYLGRVCWYPGRVFIVEVDVQRLRASRAPQHPHNNGFLRAIGVLIVGIRASVCGYGKDSAFALRDSGANVFTGEGDEDCASALRCSGSLCCLLNVTPSTCNFNIIALDHD